MARTIQQIQTEILNKKNEVSGLSGLTSTSQVSIYNLWSFVTATAIYVQESLWDIFKTELETDIANAPVGTATWVQAQAYKFQYDSVTPQIIHLTPDFVPYYDVVDETKQIINRASVKTLSNNFVSVKVAKQEPPIPLTPTELTSFKGYLNEISFAGVSYNTVSYNPDKLMVGATIYYNGQYAATVSADTLTAINNYLVGLPFDEFVRVSKLEDALQAVPGVTDVVMNNVALRSTFTAFSGATYLVQSNTEIFNKYPTFAGYAITETTSGYTPSDTLVFIAD